MITSEQQKRAHAGDNSYGIVLFVVGMMCICGIKNVLIGVAIVSLVSMGLAGPNFFIAGLLFTLSISVLYMMIPAYLLSN